MPVKEPFLWSAEDPYLYDLTIRVQNKAGVLQEVVKEHVGFRKFEMKNQMMHINGKRIAFYGVNRHEFSADSGRCITEKEILKDIITMKQHNINAIPAIIQIRVHCTGFVMHMESMLSMRRT